VLTCLAEYVKWQQQHTQCNPTSEDWEDRVVCRSDPHGGRETVSGRPSAQVTHIKTDSKGENRSNEDIANNRGNILNHTKKRNNNNNKIKR